MFSDSGDFLWRRFRDDLVILIPRNREILAYSRDSGIRVFYGVRDSNTLGTPILFP